MKYGLRFAALFLFLTLGGDGCSSSSAPASDPCSRTNCTGCCADNGMCSSGSQDDACGIFYAADRPGYERVPACAVCAVPKTCACTITCYCDDVRCTKKSDCTTFGLPECISGKCSP
jgi:hypothetical protein